MRVARRGIEAARRATVVVCDRNKQLRGHGLLLELDGEEIVVLTCHHVMATLNRDELGVRIPQPDGSLGDPVLASYVEKYSRPGTDAVVLSVDVSNGQLGSDGPWLHALDPRTYNGSLRATGLTHMQPNIYTALVMASTRLDVNVVNTGGWPDPPQRYVIPDAFVLSNTDDAREGISGSVVLCEDGIIGLAHFARAESAQAGRQDFVVPISVWAAACPALAQLIEPFVDRTLADAAIVKRSRELEVGDDLIISRRGFRPEVYLERALDQQADQSLDKCGGLMIVGRPGSGKTRLALRLLQAGSDTVSIIPRHSNPPTNFELSIPKSARVVAVFDDLTHSQITADPLSWRRRIQEVSGARCSIICISGDGREWTQLKRQHDQLLTSLGDEAQIFTSRVGDSGADLSEAEGRRLAEMLGTSADEFMRRFSGTPGSLTIDLDVMGDRYQEMREQEQLGILMNTALDAAKLLHDADLPRFPVALLEAVASRIIVREQIKPQAWNTVLKRTDDEGFGRVNEFGEFQIYRPYLDRCVEYKPPLKDVEALVPVLKEREEYEALYFVGSALVFRYESREAGIDALTSARKSKVPAPYGTFDFFLRIIGKQPDDADAEAKIREAIATGNISAYDTLALYLLNKPGREMEAEQAFHDAIAAGSQNYLNFATFLSNQPGREQDAEEYIAKAREVATEPFEKAMVSFQLANSLRKQPGRQNDAEREYKAAIPAIPDPGLRARVTFELAKLLANQPGREAEAEGLFRDAAQKGSVDAMFELGELLATQAGKKKEAEHAYRDAIAAKSKRALLGLARLLEQQPGRQGEMEDAYRSAVAAGVQGASGQYGLLLSQQAGREQEAEKAARAAIQAGDKGASYVLGLAICGEKGRQKEAEEAFQTAIHDGFEPANYNLGMLLANQPGREAEAEAAYRSAIASDIQEAHLELGALLMKTERFKEAEQAFRAAVAGGVERAHLNLGVLLMKLGRVKEAEQSLRSAIAAGDKRAFYWLGGCLIRQKGQENEALQAFQDAADAGDERAFRFVGMTLAAEPGREHDAEQYFQRAIDAGDGAAYSLLGDLLARVPGRKKDATAAYKKAIQSGDSGAREGLDRLIRPKRTKTRAAK